MRKHGGENEYDHTESKTNLHKGLANIVCSFPTILGLARAVVWLRQVALHTAAGVGAICVCACLTASPVHCTLVKV